MPIKAVLHKVHCGGVLVEYGLKLVAVDPFGHGGAAVSDQARDVLDADSRR